MENMRSRKAAEEAVKILFKKIEKVIGEISYVSLKKNSMTVDFNFIKNTEGDYFISSGNPLIHKNTEDLYSAGEEFFSGLEGICDPRHTSVIALKENNSYLLCICEAKEISDTVLPSEIIRQIDEICKSMFNCGCPFYKAVPSDVTYYSDGKISVTVIPLAVYDRKNLNKPVGVGIPEYFYNPEYYKNTHILYPDKGSFDFFLKSEKKETSDFFKKYAGNFDNTIFLMESDEETGDTTLESTVYRTLEYTF